MRLATALDAVLQLAAVLRKLANDLVIASGGRPVEDTGPQTDGLPRLESLCHIQSFMHECARSKARPSHSWFIPRQVLVGKMCKSRPFGRLPMFTLSGSASDIGQALDSLDVADRDLAGAAIFLSVKGHFLALDQSAQACALKSRCMNENILAAAVRLDKAETFLIVVELHNT